LSRVQEGEVGRRKGEDMDLSESLRRGSEDEENSGKRKEIQMYWGSRRELHDRREERGEKEKGR